MSENSLQAEKKNVKKYDSMSQRALFMRRKWVVLITIVSCLLIYPVSLVIGLISTINLNMFDAGVPVGIKLVNTFNLMLGNNIVGFMATAVLAVLSATQGFSYLFNRVTADFYESSPHTKKQRFRALFVNGLLIYYIPIIISFVLCFPAAALMGAMHPAMILQGIIQLLELMLLYSAVYSICIVGAMLSGNILTAMLFDLFLLLIEDVTFMAIDACGSNYFATWYDGSTADRTHFFSPLACYLKTHMPDPYFGSRPFTSQVMMAHIMKSWPDDLRLLVIFGIFAALGLLLYKKRPIECAGRGFVFIVTGYILKVIGAFYISLFTAIMLENITGGDVFVVFAGVLISSAIVCIMVQVLMIDGSAKKKLYHVAISALAVIAIVIVCRFDLIGFENYIPSENSIDSCALMNFNDSGFSYFEKDDYGAYEEQYDGRYILNRMKLKNVADVIELAREGQRLKCENERMYKGFSRSYYDDFEEMDVSFSNNWNYVVLFNLKNGKKVYRMISIPVDVDATLMDRITSSDEFRSAILQCEDDFVNELKNSAGKNHTLMFYNGCRESKRIDGTLIGEFLDAYEKDIKTKYSYSDSRFNMPKGSVQFNEKDDNTDYIFDQSYFLNYPVFEDYDNTIAFLKQHDIYFDELIPLEMVDSIRVTKTGDDGEEKETEYTSETEISELMPKLYSDYGTWDWQDPGYVDYERQADVTTKRDIYEDEYFKGETYTLYFLSEESLKKSIDR